MKRIILIAFFTLLAVGLPLTAQMIYKSDKNLSDNGIEIEATIISAEGKGMSQDVKVEYINDKGEKVTAKGVVKASKNKAAKGKTVKIMIKLKGTNKTMKTVKVKIK